MGGRRIAQAGNSKFREYPREHDTLRERGRVHYGNSLLLLLVSGLLVSPQKFCGQGRKTCICVSICSYMYLHLRVGRGGTLPGGIWSLVICGP